MNDNGNSRDSIINKTEKSKKYDKIETIVLLVILVPLLLFSLNTTNWTHAYREMWFVCLDYLEEGTLYGGQPFCEQGGPFLYLFPFIFKKIFGNFQITTRIFVTILAMISLFLMVRISKKETGKANAAFIAILFLILLYPYVSGDTYNYPVASMMFLFGFYILYYSVLRFKEILAGILFIVAAYINATVLLPTAIIIAFYVFRVGLIKIKRDERKKIKLLVRYKKVFNIFLIVLPMFVVFLIFQLLYPNILKYIVFSHLQDPVFTFTEALKDMIPFGFINQSVFVVYIVLICCIFLFIKNRSVIPVIAGVSIFWGLFNDHQHFGGLYFGRTLFLPFLFIILTLAILKEKVRKASFGKIFLYSAIFIIIVYPGLNPFPFVYGLVEDKVNVGISNFQKEVGYGINFIPKQDGNILAEYPELLTKYDFDFDNEKLDVAGDTEYRVNIDEFSGPRLAKLGVTNLSDWDALILDESKARANEIRLGEIRNLMLAKNYSMIAIGPRSGATLIAQAFNSLDASFKDQYCRVIIPNLEHLPITSIHIATIYLKNTQDCQTTFLKMIDYYDRVFDRVCKKSTFAANNVVNIILNPFGRQKFCGKGGNFIDNFNHIAFFPEHLAFIFGIVALFLILYIPVLIKDNKFNKKSNIIIYSLIITLLIIIAIFLLIRSYSDYNAFFNFISNT